ncbi:hypothetical protein KXW37_008194, partial [Aspergillus fumigatus]
MERRGLPRGQYKTLQYIAGYGSKPTLRWSNRSNKLLDGRTVALRQLRSGDYGIAFTKVAD